MKRPLSLAVLGALASGISAELPEEPVDVGTETQVFVDDYIIDNHWALRFGKEAVRRVLHQPTKHPSNPIIAGDGGYVNVLHDQEADLYRMWYQAHNPHWREEPGRPKTGIAYAESDDGITWRRPNLGLYEWRGREENNLSWIPPSSVGASGGHVIDATTLPEEDRRGYRYIMVYSSNIGLGLVGSQDGIHWDAEGATGIKHIHSDTYNNILYDAADDRYILTLRPKHIYRVRQEKMIDSGMSRRVARLVNDQLWSGWEEAQPQTLLVPDETDLERGFTAFYGMDLTKSDGVYWGFLWPFRFNDDIYTELVTSRDAEHYRRLSGEPRLLDMGGEGAWDDGMVFGSSRWMEVGNRWLVYYGGHDGPHGIRERTPGIGLATIRKHGFVSLSGPPGGGLVCTRRLTWPGGNLVINADAHRGDLTVRVSDAERKPLEGFDHIDCIPFRGNNTDHVVQWKSRSLEELAGREIRLEFYLKDTDLYSFRSASGDVTDGRIDPGNDATATPPPVDREIVAAPPTGGEEVLHLSFDESEGTPADAYGAKVTQGDGENEATFPRSIEDGRHGGALRFSEPGRFLRVHPSEAYRPASGRIELWFRPNELIDGSAETNHYLLSLHQTGALRVGLMLRQEDGRLEFSSRRKDEVTVDVHSDAGRWEAGRWYHVVVAFGRDGLRLYVDGKLQEDTDPTRRGLDFLEGGSLFLGSALPRFGGEYTFPGDLDEVRIVREGDE